MYAISLVTLPALQPNIQGFDITSSMMAGVLFPLAGEDCIAARYEFSLDNHIGGNSQAGVGEIPDELDASRDNSVGNVLGN